MALASKGATERNLILLECLASFDNGIEFVNTTSFNGEDSMRSTAGPESTACVAQALTLRAPCCNRASAPFTSVPAVSIRSSTIKQFRPSTQPTTFITSATFGWVEGRNC